MTQEIVVSLFLFAAVYFEVFMLLTLFERHEDIVPSPLADTDGALPSVTIIVPCWNEEKTVARTVESLLDLDYPGSRLHVSIVDDGSTDGTWAKIQTFKSDPRVDLYKKENGGKYTAMNYGIERCRTDLVGCLDADSFVAKDALRKMVAVFQSDPEIMAVAPAVKIWKPDNIIRSMQYVEYVYGIFMKKLYSFLGAIHVAPGPFSIFRRELFAEIGMFKHAHNTEDMEIAMRMQRHHKKIGNCHDAYVYTVGPKNFKALHKQRLRWTYGFFRNVIDYRDLLLNPGKGNIGLITLPFPIISVVGLLVVLGLFTWNVGVAAAAHVTYWQAVSGHALLPPSNFDMFFVSVTTVRIVTIFAFVTGFLILIGGQYTVRHVCRVRDTLLYVLLYPFLAMTWILRSVFNLVTVKATSWR